MRYKVQLTCYGFTEILADSWEEAEEKVEKLEVGNFDVSETDMEILEEIPEEHDLE